MSHAITMYEADDGSRWDVEAKAVERDELIAECQAKEQEIGLRPVPKDDGCKFGNGGGFVQQPAGSRDLMIGFLKSKRAHRDSDGPIGRMLGRAYRLDDNDREWGQQYYATHPDEGEQFEAIP